MRVSRSEWLGKEVSDTEHEGELTYWGRDKMTDISQMIFQMRFLEWKYMNFD